jgi:hypothetical protein
LTVNGRKKLTQSGCCINGLEKMGKFTVFYRPDMGGIGLEGMPGDFIGALMNRKLHENIGDNCIRSGEMTVFLYEGHTAAFVPLDRWIEKGQCGRNIT